LYRVLAEWALAILEEAPCLDIEEAEALIRFLDVEEHAVTPLRSEEPSVTALVEMMPTILYEDALFMGIRESAAARLALKLASMHPIQRLGVLMKAAWAREMRDGKRSPHRQPQDEADAVLTARLVAPDSATEKASRS
ncbi:hypothetical protein, partial [Thermomicrobium sp.]